MSELRIISFILLLFSTLSFKSTSACEYAGSNINFVRTQTEKAIASKDLNLIRYHTFKALNAIDKSKKELKACSCESANIGIEESAYLLKKATRAFDTEDTKELLERSLRNTVSSIDALRIHEKEHSRKRTKTGDFSITTKDSDEIGDIDSLKSGQLSAKEKLDILLDDYRKSLDQVVQTVNCKDARTYAEGIYDDCEQELLKEGLSEEKKYYNLKTQEITAEAILCIQEKCEK